MPYANTFVAGHDVPVLDNRYELPKIDNRQLYPAKRVCVLSDSYKAFDSSRAFSCIDPRLDGGLPGGALTPALMASYATGYKLIGGLAVYHNLVRPAKNRSYATAQLLMHHDCTALGYYTEALKLIVEDDKSLQRLHKRLWDRELSDESYERITAWATKLIEDGVDAQEVINYASALRHCSIIDTRGENTANAVIVNLRYGWDFVGQDDVKDVLGARPYVINAWRLGPASVSLKRTYGDTEVTHEAAEVGRLFTTAIILLVMRPNMLVFQTKPKP